LTGSWEAWGDVYRETEWTIAPLPPLLNENENGRSRGRLTDHFQNGVIYGL